MKRRDKAILLKYHPYTDWSHDPVSDFMWFVTKIDLLIGPQNISLFAGEHLANEFLELFSEVQLAKREVPPLTSIYHWRLECVKLLVYSPIHLQMAVPWLTVILWRLSAKSRIRPQASPCGIYGVNGVNIILSSQTRPFSPASVSPSLLHTHPSIYHLHYLISGKDNTFKWRTKIVAGFRFFLPVSLKQWSHIHSSATDTIHSQQPTVSLKKSPSAVSFMRGICPKRQILL